MSAFAPLLLAASAVIIVAPAVAPLLHTLGRGALHLRDPVRCERPKEVSPANTHEIMMWNAWVGFTGSHGFGASSFGPVCTHRALVQRGLHCDSVPTAWPGTSLRPCLSALGLLGPPAVSRYRSVGVSSYVQSWPSGSVMNASGPIFTAHSAAADPFDLARFQRAQAGVYAQALAELRAGQKRSHWMWFVFPQFAGLGMSATSQRYAINSLAEADAYLRHPLLGPRLAECTEAVLDLTDRTARQVFATPDDLKFCSSMTLFEQVSGPGSIFATALEKYFAGGRDERTLELVRLSTGGGVGAV